LRLPDNRSATRLPIFPDAPTIMIFMMGQLLNSDLQESRHVNSIKNQLQNPVFCTQIRLIDIFGEVN